MDGDHGETERLWHMYLAAVKRLVAALARLERSAPELLPAEPGVTSMKAWTADQYAVMRVCMESFRDVAEARRAYENLTVRSPR